MAEPKAFLLNKIHAAVEDTKSKLNDKINSGCGTCSWLLKQPDFNKDFDKIKDLINKKIEADSFTLYYLYYINNVTAEWLKLLERPHRLNQRLPCLVYMLHQKLKNTIKEFQSSLSHKEAGTESLPRVDRAKTCLPNEIEAYHWSSPAEVRTYGIEDKVEIMDRLLLDKDSFNAIGVVGMTGVGKTALCQVAFNDQQVKEKFFPRIWVCLSTQPKDPKNEKEYLKEVLKRMLKCLGFEEDAINKPGQDCDLDVLLMSLRQELKGKRYLIVLDDVRISTEKKELYTALSANVDKYKQNGKEDSSHVFPKGDGGTVLVTSRYSEMAAAIVGEKNWIRLLPLADKKSCWNICKEAAPEDDNITKLEDEIEKKCYGLPLLSKMMGKIMKEKAGTQMENHQYKTPKETNQQVKTA